MFYITYLLLSTMFTMVEGKSPNRNDTESTLFDIPIPKDSTPSRTLSAKTVNLSRILWSKKKIDLTTESASNIIMQKQPPWKQARVKLFCLLFTNLFNITCNIEIDEDWKSTQRSFRDPSFKINLIPTNISSYNMLLFDHIGAMISMHAYQEFQMSSQYYE